MLSLIKEVKDLLKDCHLENLPHIAQLNNIELDTARELRKWSRNSQAAADYRKRQNQEVVELEMKIQRAKQKGEELSMREHQLIQSEKVIEIQLDKACMRLLIERGEDPQLVGVSFKDSDTKQISTRKYTIPT